MRQPRRLRDESSDRRLKEYWWGFKRPTFEMYEAIETSERVLTRARIANLHSMVWVPNGWVYGDKSYVFVNCPFSVLQSNVHDVWARQYSSTLRTDMQYTSTACFETFPFRTSDLGQAERVGEAYHNHRRAVMLKSQEGLTPTYNRFHDPADRSADIQKLRDLHVEMDQAVAAAYGWTDLDLGHGLHETKPGVRFTLSEAARREVLGRLLKLNHERYAEEVAQGLHQKKKPRNTRKTRKKAADNEEGKLYG